MFENKPSLPGWVIFEEPSALSNSRAVMASSFKLEFPLNEGLPNTEHARDRLLAKVFKFRKDRAISRFSSDEDYSLLYAYGRFPRMLIS